MATAKAVLGKLWDELKPAADQGRSEVAAALFSGSAYVMYPRPDQPGLTPDAPPPGNDAPTPVVDLDSLRAKARETEAARGSEPERDDRDRGGTER